jgi:drug/metabolite transporter (DMT)-like permease
MQTGINRTMGRVEWLLLGLLSVLWGGSFFFGKYAVRELDPLTIVMGRVVLAALALNLIVRLAGHAMPVEPRRWGAFLTMGVFNNVVPFTLIFWGQTRIASGLASVLTAMTPLFAALLAHLFTDDERLTTNRLAGVLLGIAGAAVLIGSDALGNLGGSVIGQLAVLGAALSYAAVAIYGRRLRGTPPLVSATGQVTCSALLMVVIAPLVDRPWEAGMPSGRVILAVVALALLSTVVAYVIYFRLLASAGATNLLVVNFLIPPSAILLGLLFLDERLHTGDLLGMALIALGLLAIDGRVLRRLGRSRAMRVHTRVGA